MWSLHAGHAITWFSHFFSFNRCCSESIFYVPFLFFSCTRMSVWLFNCAENNMGRIVHELKTNLEAASLTSLVSHVLGPFSPHFCKKKGMTKCIWCIENSPERVYLPAVVETCEKKNMHDDWWCIPVSRPLIYKRHFVICSIHVLYKYFLVPWVQLVILVTTHIIMIYVSRCASSQTMLRNHTKQNLSSLFCQHTLYGSEGVIILSQG